VKLVEEVLPCGRDNRILRRLYQLPEMLVIELLGSVDERDRGRVGSGQNRRSRQVDSDLEFLFNIIKLKVLTTDFGGVSRLTRAKWTINNPTTSDPAKEPAINSEDLGEKAPVRNLKLHINSCKLVLTSCEEFPRYRSLIQKR
jgi:hypothetical protein